ncbi:MAG: hypothetical protein H6742_00465 [Alphaproteobacteria bacterium]|nr:hypothetical protein [Alphaproteobacteria bacterium]
MSLLLLAMGCMSLRAVAVYEPRKPVPDRYPDPVDGPPATHSPPVVAVLGDLKADFPHYSFGYSLRGRGGPQAAELALGIVACLDSSTPVLVEGCGRVQALDTGYRDHRGFLGVGAPSAELATWIPLTGDVDGAGHLVLSTQVGYDLRWAPIRLSHYWWGVGVGWGWRVPAI